MDRRDLLKFGALAGGVFAIPGLTGFNDIKNGATIARSHLRLLLNDLEILLFSDGRITLNNPQPIFAPGINAAEVKDSLKKIFLAQDKLECAINVMLIKKGRRIILVDTGSGYHFGDTGGWLQHNLETAGIKAGDVTDIFITHAHIDHIGGIIGKNKTFVYPNAKYYLAKKEYDFWMSAHPDFSKSNNPEVPAERLPFVQEVFHAIKDKLTLFNYGDTLFSCISTALAEGHTPGHTIFTVSSGNKSIKHIVDIVHTTLLIEKPDWGTQWDVDFAKGVATRKQVLADSYLHKTLVMTTHLPWPGLGYIDKHEDNYQWMPFPYFTPDEIVL